MVLRLATPPGLPLKYPQEGAMVRRLNTKTNVSGVSTNKARTQTDKNKQKIRDLRLRWQQTGTLVRPKMKARPASATRSEIIPLSQAIKEYIAPTQASQTNIALTGPNQEPRNKQDANK